MGGVDAAVRARDGHEPCDAGAARRLRLVPSAGADREDGGDRRRDLGWSLRPRARRRLRRVGARNLRAADGAARIAVRGIVRDRPPAARRRTRHVRGGLLHGGRRRAPAEARTPRPVDGREHRTADARDHAPARPGLEHLVHVVREHGRRVQGAERDDRRGGRGGRPRPARRSRAAPAFSSSSTPRQYGARTTRTRCPSRPTESARCSTSWRRPVRTRRSSSSGRSPRSRSARSARRSGSRS